MSGIGIVTGLNAEARILRRIPNLAPERLACAGASTARARAAAERLAAAGATGLLSFGVAGGLTPELPPGSLVLAEAVVEDGEPRAASAGWHAAVLAVAGPGLALRAGTLAGSDRPLTSAADKARLHRTSGALAVDMESHAVAAVAAARGLPFLALRAVADPADRSIPAAALGAIGPDGRSRLGPVLAGLARRPWELPALLALNDAFRQALGALERAVTELEAPLLRGP